jgi:hypothetical protein
MYELVPIPEHELVGAVEVEKHKSALYIAINNFFVKLKKKLRR